MNADLPASSPLKAQKQSRSASSASPFLLLPNLFVRQRELAWRSCVSQFVSCQRAQGGIRSVEDDLHATLSLIQRQPLKEVVAEAQREPLELYV